MDEKALEKEIQDKGLVAPRLTPDLIDAVIVDRSFTLLPNKRTLVCQITLLNGYTVEGVANCVSVENFNQEIGEKISFANARDKVWELEGYLLKQRLYNAAKLAQ